MTSENGFTFWRQIRKFCYSLPMQQTLDGLLYELSSLDFCDISWPIEDFATKRRERCEELNNWCRICDKFLETPQLLDRQLRKLITELALRTKHSLELLQSFSKSCDASKIGEKDFSYFCSPFIALYHISKVRGFKCVAKLFPSQVDDLFTVLQLWKIFQEFHTLEDFPWQVAYILLLWMSTLSLIPFSIVDFDHSIESADDIVLIDDIIGFAKQMLSASSKIQCSAAYFLAKILTRQDMQGQLSIYLQELLTLWEKGDRMDVCEEFQIGSLRTIAWMFEFGTRNSFDGMIERLLSIFLKGMNSTTNITIRHLCAKNIQRLGLLFLPKKGASWLSKKRFSGLNESTENSEQSTLQGDRIDERAGSILATVMETLLQQLDDKHNVTRYSVAKGIGRICMRLPEKFSYQVLELLLSQVDSDLGKHYGYLWHGACLTLAECARRGIFGEEHLKVIVRFVSQALRYDFAKGSVHTGSQVRDAACYVCWAFARSYNSSIKLVFLKELVASVVCVACTDRELNCRRAAAAALQELVGRTNLVSQGIYVITTADYFTLSDLSDSYLKVLPEVAFLDDEWYRLPLIDELVHRKITHWDSGIRHLASNSLAVLVAKDFDMIWETFQTVMKQLFVNIFSDEPETRHGCLLAIYKLLHSIQEEVKLKSIMTPYYEELFQFIQEQVYNTSFDFIQIAICQLLGCFFERRLFCEPLFIRKIVDQMQSNNKEVQDAAAQAFGSVCRYLCWKRTNGEFDGAIEHYVMEIIIEMVHFIRLEQNLKINGFLKALAYVPAYIVDEKITESDETLRTAILAEFLKFGKKPHSLEIPGTLEEDNEQVIELKITCVESMTHFAIHLLNSTNETDMYWDTQLEDVFHFLLGGIDDYTTGSRGDIGSWVRITSMKCFGQLSTSMKTHTKYKVENLLKYGIYRLVRNCFERIDKTRISAAETLKALYDNLEPYFIQKFEMDTLHDIFHDFEPSLFLDYDRLFQNGIVILKRNTTFTLPILHGFLAAFGGNGSQNKEANKAMECYLKDFANESVHMLTMLLKNLLVILTVDNKTRRNLIPIIRMLTLIMETTTKIDLETVLNDLLTCLIQRVKNSKDMNLLLAFTEMLVEALAFQTTIARIASQRLMLYLLHPFAKVRQFVSDRMQIQLLTHEDYFVQTLGKDNYHQAMQILEQIEWDKHSPTKLKEERNRLCTAFGLECPL